MKKLMQALFIITIILSLTSCSKKDLKPVNIGNLDFTYDANVWDYQENSDQTAPLEFKDKKGNSISLFVSQESTYQHPLDMISFYETMVSTYDDYKVFLAPTEVEVNGTSWYECGFSYKDGAVVRKIYQRYYGKFYNVASISYASTEENYEYGYKEALKLMSDIKTTDVPNDEKSAKAQLVGEWEVVNSGYLIFKDDGTYEWYKDTSKDKNNMHYGTYGCDTDNASLSLKEGDGIYLVLFPEALIVDGKNQESSSIKNDYIISFEQTEAEGYKMVNMATYSLYYVIKQ